jgi:N-acetylglucosaminyl-diphospho-decaprenol L-rhamnosyltransferase
LGALLTISLNVDDGHDLLLQIVIVAYNSEEVLKECLASIAASRIECSYQVTVFDNASAQSSRGLCEAQTFPSVQFVESAINLGFGRANNAAVKLSKSKYILLLNPDAVVSELAIHDAMAALNGSNKIGIVGASLFSPDGQPEPSARFSPTVWSLFAQKIGMRAYFGQGERGDLRWTRESIVECDWVPGCFYLFRRTLLGELGLFDPRYFLYYEEVDHCKRVRQIGYKVICSPQVKVTHIGGASAETVAAITQNGRQISPLQLESELLFLRKHFGLIGLLLHLVLSALACLIVLCKTLIKRRDFQRFKTISDDMKLMVRLCVSTSFGRKPIH